MADKYFVVEEDALIAYGDIRGVTKAEAEQMLLEIFTEIEGVEDLRVIKGEIVEIIQATSIKLR